MGVHVGLLYLCLVVAIYYSYVLKKKFKKSIIDILLYKSTTKNMILIQGVSLNQMTPIVGVFLENKTCASKIFTRNLKF